MSANKLPKAKALTKKQFKELRIAGLDPSTSDAEGEKAIARISLDMVDWICDNVYPDTDFDETPFNECLKLAQETYRLTVGSAEAAGN